MNQYKATISPKNVVNLFICRLDVSQRDLNTKLTLGDCLFGAVKLTKNADLNKYGYSGYGIDLDARLQILLPSREWDKLDYFWCRQ